MAWLHCPAQPGLPECRCLRRHVRAPAFGLLASGGSTHPADPPTFFFESNFCGLWAVRQLNLCCRHRSYPAAPPVAAAKSKMRRAASAIWQSMAPRPVIFG